MKVYKVDTMARDVRCVEGGEYPATDSEGDTCYINTHFKDRSDALNKLQREGEAWLQLNARERKRLIERLQQLDAEDKQANECIERAASELKAEMHGTSESSRTT